MVLIEIDKDSIKKNPNAGNDKLVESGPWEANFKLEGDLPDYLKEGENFILTSEWHGKEFKNSPMIHYYEGAILNPNVVDRLKKENKCTVNQFRKMTTHYHLPEGQWHYKYKSKNIKCSNCKSMIDHSDIIEDYSGGEDEVYYEECPICHKLNTFDERKYQRIDEVAK